MFIETYEVGNMDGRKVIHYKGFTWARQLYEGIMHGTKVEKEYAVTEGTFCCIEIEERNYKRACEALELVNQYQYDMDEDELLDYEFFWKSEGSHLHMDEVTQDTPCGMYWFELDEA